MARAPGKSKQHSPPPADTSIPPRLLNRRAAAGYLSVSTPTLDAFRAQGLVRPVRLPDVRGGGQLRTPLFDRHDLDSLIEKCKAGGAE